MYSHLLAPGARWEVAARTMEKKFNETKEFLQSRFTFRKWNDSGTATFVGSTVTQDDDFSGVDKESIYDAFYTSCDLFFEIFVFFVAII